MSDLKTRLAEARDAAGIARLPRGHFIDGTFVTPSAGNQMDSFDPGLGKAFASFANGTADDVDRAVQSARKAQRAWQLTPPPERGRILLAISNMIRAEGKRLALVEMFDAGKRLSEAEGDVKSAARTFEYYAGAADKLEGSQIPVGTDYLAYTINEPVGVVGQIIPWNYPLTSAVRGVAPALACGCAVVLKPAEQTPFTALLLAEICVRAGLPAGLFNVVTGTGASVGGPLTAHPGIDHITFTGSVPTGQPGDGGSGAQHHPRDAGAWRQVAACADGRLQSRPRHSRRDGGDLRKCRADLLGRLAHHRRGRRSATRWSNACRRRWRISRSATGSTISMSAPSIPPNSWPASKAMCSVPKPAATGSSQAEAGLRRKMPATAGISPRPWSKPAIPPIRSCRKRCSARFSPCRLPTTSTMPWRLPMAPDYALAACIHTADLSKAVRFARDVDAGQIYVNEYFAAGVEVPFGGNGKSGFGRARGFEA